VSLAAAFLQSGLWSERGCDGRAVAVPPEDGRADLRAGLRLALRPVSWAHLPFSKYEGFFCSCVFYNSCRNRIYL